jgi:hypothetical protein
MSSTIAPRLVVSSAFASECIVVESASTPDPSWIALQQDERVRHVPADTRWWTLFPLGGGALLCAEPFLTVVREASYDDFLRAVEHANVDGQRRLAALFPDYSARALAAVSRET